MAGHKLSALQWGELRAAHLHLGQMLDSTSSEVTDRQWMQLHTIREHLSQILAPHTTVPYPSPQLHPSQTLYP